MDDFTRFLLLSKIFFHFENFLENLLNSALLNTNYQNEIKNIKGFFTMTFPEKTTFKTFRHSCCCRFFLRGHKNYTRMHSFCRWNLAAGVHNIFFYWTVRARTAGVKGTVSRDFCFWFFWWISLPFRIFSKIRGDIRSSRFATGVNDTGGKWKKSSIRKFFMISFGQLWVEELAYGIFFFNLILSCLQFDNCSHCLPPVS